MVLLLLSTTCSRRGTKSLMMNMISKNNNNHNTIISTMINACTNTSRTTNRKRFFSNLVIPTKQQQLESKSKQQQLTIPSSLLSIRNINNLGLINKMQVRYHGGPQAAHDAATVSINFVQTDDLTPIKTITAKVGESLLIAARRNDVELEGACEGVCACSTCHVVLDDDAYDELEEPTEDEEDMLDMAFGLQETSRLGCQIIITEEMDELQVQVPGVTRNFYVDGHVPQPH